MKKVLFISSTGGHLYELLSLNDLFKLYDYYIVTEHDKTNDYLKKEYTNRIYFLPYSTRSKPFQYIILYTYVILKSLFLFIKIKPDVIVSTGTHTAVPMCYFSKLLGKKIIYIETYANKTKKSLSGTLIYPISDLFIVQWKEMKKLYPKSIIVSH